MSLFPCTRGSANAMDVIFGHIWQIKVYDKIDPGHINATSGNICGG
jgi:hypothetical protein